MKHPNRPHPRTRGLSTGLLTALIGIVATGCFVPGATDGPRGEVLSVAMPWPPVQDYVPFGDDGTILSRLGVTESLTTLGPAGAVQPALATDWRRTGPRVWHLDLRAGVRFHDGTEMTAEHVVASLRAAAGASPVPSAIAGRGWEPSVVDRDTVRLSTGTADPSVPQRLSSPHLPVLARGAFAGDGVDPRGHATGPFALTTTEGVAAAELTAHRDHWAGPPRLEGLDVRFLPDAASRAAAFEAGEVQVSHTVSTAEAVAQEESLVEVPLPRDVLVYLHAGRPATDTRPERAAVAAAVDQEVLAETVFEGRADVASGLFGPATPWAQQRPALPAPPRAATPDGPMTIATYAERPELPQVADAVAAELRKTGVVVRQVVRPYSLLEADLLRGRYDVVVGSRSYAVDTGEPLDYLHSDFGCRGDYNLTGLCDRDVEKVLRSLGSDSGRGERRRAALAAEHAVLASGVVVPVVHERARYLVHDTVVGIAEDPYERRFLTGDTRLR